MHTFRTLVWLGLFFCSVGVSAQNPGYRHYSLDDGLPTASVYEILQDHIGYIWLAHEKGVSRFDGYAFENFTMKDGLPGNEVLKIRQDSQGRIWFLAFNGRAGFYHQGKFHHPGNDPALKNCEVAGYYTTLFEDSQKRIWLASSKGEVIKMEPEEPAEKVSFTEMADFQGIVFLVWENPDGSVIGFSSTGYTFDLKEGKPIRKVPGSLSRLHGFRLDNGQNLTANIGKVILSDPWGEGKHLTELDRFIGRQVNAIQKLTTGEIAISSHNGVVLFPDEKLAPESAQHLLQGKTISSVLVDREGNYWFTTLDDGIYFKPSGNLLIWNEADGLWDQEVQTLYMDRQDRLWLGFKDGKTGYLEKGKFVQVALPIVVRGRAKCRQIYEDQEGVFWFAYETHLLRLEGERGTSLSIISKLISPAPDGSIYAGGVSGLFRFQPGDRLTPYKVRGRWEKEMVYRGRINALVFSPSQGMLAATNNGMKIGLRDSLFPLPVPAPFNNIQINDLKVSADETLIMSTHGHGLGLLRDGNLTIIDQEKGLASDFCGRMTIAGGNILWVCTNKGLSRIELKEPHRIRNYSIEGGTPDNEIADILIQGDSAWVATSRGLYFFRTDEKEQSFEDIPFFFSNISISNRDTSLSTSFTLPHDQNRVRISFKGLAYRDPGEILYRFKMAGLDSSWVETKQRTAIYPFLPPGDYTFLVDIAPDGRTWRNTPLSLAITIRKPLWQRTWFILIVLVFLIVSSGWVVRWRYRVYAEKEGLERKVESFRQSALQAQMNPHFIFNALNSVQQFITGRDHRSALLYLSKFSKLIRLTLDHSRANFVSISKDLESLNLYLELEALRVGDKFAYEIRVAPGIDPDFTTIPSMMVQPMVENAIWHGLMTVKGEAFLKVTYNEVGEFIDIIVEDNGIGRAASASIQAAKKGIHTSLGLKNLEERLVVLNRIAGTDGQTYEIEDKRNPDGSAAGTIVRIRVRPQTY